MEVSQSMQVPELALFAELILSHVYMRLLRWAVLPKQITGLTAINIFIVNIFLFFKISPRQASSVPI
jgi:hypothetical protein